MAAPVAPLEQPPASRAAPRLHPKPGAALRAISRTGQRAGRGSKQTGGEKPEVTDPAPVEFNASLARGGRSAQIGAHLLHDRSGCRVPESIGVHHVGAVDGDPELPEAAFQPSHLECRLLRELRCHPGSDEGLAGSDGTVVNLDATHADARDEGWDSRRTAAV